MVFYNSDGENISYIYKEWIDEIKKNQREKQMEFKIIKYLSRLMFVLVVVLIVNHWFRGLNWLPLTALLLPAYGMLLFAENLENE